MYMYMYNTLTQLCISAVQFHVGHVHHINGDYIKAKQSFEWILASKNVPNDIKALTLRQLGMKQVWLLHPLEQISGVRATSFKPFPLFFFQMNLTTVE